MFLVDTSVWIEVFRKGSRFRLPTLADLEEVVTCLPVVQEVLQAFRDDRAFRRAREAMPALPIVESPLRSIVFEEAVDLYRAGRGAGPHHPLLGGLPRGRLRTPPWPYRSPQGP